MTSFGWKRKLGQQIRKEKSKAFEQDSKDEEPFDDSVVDWLTLAPKRKAISLEDAVAKSMRLKDEGTVLAESERYWEALKKWDQALSLTPNDTKIHEMKAQAYLQLCEVFPALQSAERAVQCEPTWWEAHQTLGRAQLALGEVKMAVRSFSVALHINPAEPELWEEDYKWALSLLEKQKNIEESLEKANLENNIQIKEITEVDVDETPVNCQSDDDNKNFNDGFDSSGKVQKYNGKIIKEETSVDYVPGHYIMMRDSLYKHRKKSNDH